MFLLMTPFNSLFLLYVAMFTFAFWSLVLLLRSIDVESFKVHFARDFPARPLAAFLGVIAVGNAVAWMANVIPALFHSESPAFIAGTGLYTSPNYAQDLAFWIPLTAVAAALLWRRRAWGFVLAGGLLVYLFIESISIAADQWLGGAADPSSTVASQTGTPIFVAIAVSMLVPLFFYFRGVVAASSSIRARRDS
jgi:hypothetical protein